MITVQDCNGRVIQVGSRVLYGSPPVGERLINTAIVTAISDPDIYEYDDVHGQERVGGLVVYITIRFPDGSTDEVRASDITSYYGPPEAMEDIDQTFEEPGDLEVLSDLRVVAGQIWRSLDPRDDGFTCTVLSTSGPGGYVHIQRFRKTRVRYDRFIKAYELVAS